MNSKSLFMNNFKFKKNRADHENLNYKSVESNFKLKDEEINKLNNENSFTKKICVPSKHVLSIDKISINKELGKGEFGVVQQGIWTNDNNKRIQVAIKCLSKQQMQNNSLEFLKEAAIMHNVDHPNIVRLFGVVLDGNSWMLVTELAPLRSLLECLKDQNIKSNFTIPSLCDFAFQVCDGMQYLEKKRLINRDLAARNILVFAKNLVKISDFGLSRALGVGKDYYQTNFNESLKLPIAWCAPECINYLKFTTYSDVWSYGVTLWEMFSYGYEPWIALTGKQILEAIDEPNFQRLEQPDCCPKDYYTIMLKCWEHDPNKRPKFSEIINILPDCKPELLMAVKEWNLNEDDLITKIDSNSQIKFLKFNVGDIIIVLDKYPILSDSLSNICKNFWKGCSNSETGLFNPNKTVSYLGQNLPTCSNNLNNQISSLNSNGLSLSVLIKSILDKNINHSNYKNSTSCLKKKLNPEMISKPQGDLKHTGHVGADGVFFGDISYLGDKYHLISKQCINSYKPTNDFSDKISLSRNSSDLSDKAPLLNNLSLKTNSLDKKNLKELEKNINKKNFKNLISSNGNTNNDHEYHEISDDDENSRFVPLDFGPSLMDEVFKELNFGSNHDLSKDLNLHSIEENKIHNSIKCKEKSNNSQTNTNKKKQSMVKQISASEQQSLDSAIAIVKELATKSMMHFDCKENNDNITLLDNCSLSTDSPRTLTSPNKKKFTFKFSKSNKETKSFSDSLASTNENIAESIISQEAKEAYESLIGSNLSNFNPIKESNEKSTTNTISNNENIKIRSKLPNNNSKTISRSSLPAPPPIPKGNVLLNHNPLPLPPRDRTKPFITLKQHERKHPLIIPDMLDTCDINDSLLSTKSNLNDNVSNEPKQIMSTFKPNMPLNRNVSFKNDLFKINQNILINSSPSSIKKSLVIQTSNLHINEMNEINTQKCSQIPVNVFTGLPTISHDEEILDHSNNETKTIQENHNLNSLEKKQNLISFENSNIKIDVSKLWNNDADEIRVMQKVLVNEVQLSIDECKSILNKTNWDVHKAIKCVRLRETLKSYSIVLDSDLVEVLTKFNWNIRQASNYFIATQGISDRTTEV